MDLDFIMENKLDSNLKIYARFHIKFSISFNHIDSIFYFKFYIPKIFHNTSPNFTIPL